MHAFIHSYSFIISCQNATKHELDDAINSRMLMTLQYYDKMSRFFSWSWQAFQNLL